MRDGEGRTAVTGEYGAEPTVAETGDPALDLTACDREPIHVPGSIQPYGLLLVVDPASLHVVGGAGAIEERLAPEWLDRPLGALIGQEFAASRALAEAEPGTPVPLETVDGARERFEAVMHRAPDHLLVELEPRTTGASAAALMARLDAFGTSFERATDLRSLCDRAAIAFRELTGFDRVMVYRFLDDAAGVVVAEDRDPTLGSFNNHHFPASDIPKQARALYVRNRVRVIAEVDYAPAPLRPAGRGLETLDLSDSALRSVSPIHLQYLTNMGVAASASISIVKDGLLWGLIACHHNSPRTMAFETRTAARALAGGLARQIRAKEEAENYRERIRLRAGEDVVIGRMAQERPFEALLEASGEDIRRMLDADGLAFVQGSRRFTVGACPPDDALGDIARFAQARAGTEPFATATLPSAFPAAAAHGGVASGLLAVTLALEVPALLMWFRAEHREIVEWAGNPHKDATGPLGELTPRSSFAAWTEEVRGRARRWTLNEIEAAQRLRRALFEVRQSRRLRELNRELGTALADKEGLLLEKEHLLREVNHRVQNSLQLVSAFLALQARNETPELAAHLAEAQRRLSAVALVHRRLYQGEQVETIDLARYLEDLVGDTRSAMGEEWTGAIGLDLSPMLISADRAVNVGLILTELIINANKYAYGGGSGPIAIALEPYRNQFRLIVADQGLGQLREHQGFGTRMMNAMVQRLGGEIERFDNKPGLRVIVTAPIEA